MQLKNITSFNQLFDIYRNLISDKYLCIANQATISNLSYLIDAYSMAKIIDFFNENSDLAKNGELWKSNLFVIRNFSVVTSEIIKYLESNNYFDSTQFEEPNSLNRIDDLRNKIHQFRYQDFDKHIYNIDSSMGRSRTKTSPHLDVTLEYFVDTHKKTFMGTNISQFHFYEAKDQITVDCMQKIIRAVSNMKFLPSSDFVLKRSYTNPKYRWTPYCYTDIINNSFIKNERLVDRLLFALDDLCCIYEFFVYSILIDDYLLEAPYIIYFLSKSIAITLDETFDNISLYIKHSNDNLDKELIKGTTKNIDKEFIDYCKIFRNNLHYQNQSTIQLGTDKELYQLLLQELEITKELLFQIRKLLNINPSKSKLTFYRFLRWIQLPDKKSNRS